MQTELRFPGETFEKACQMAKIVSSQTGDAKPAVRCATYAISACCITAADIDLKEILKYFKASAIEVRRF